MCEKTINPSENSGKSFVSIIAPVYNEIETIDFFYKRMNKVCECLNRPYEIIFVDDGSSDGSTEYLRVLPRQNRHVRVIRFARNFGQQKAVMAGVDHSKGDIVLVIDVDLQVVPEDIPRLLDTMDQGFDVVSGCRPRREEHLFLRRIPSKFANFIFRRFFNLPYNDLGCGIQALKKRLLEGIDPYSALYSQRIIYACWRGARFIHLPVEYHPRMAGSTKYSFFSLLHFFLDLMLTFLIRQNELIVFFLVGSIAAVIGLVGIGFQSGLHLLGRSFSLAHFVFNLFLVFNGMILVGFGFINERINRINHQINKMPVYVIDVIWEPTESSL